MLRRNKSLSLFIAASFFLMAAILYGVTTVTFNLNIFDNGGTPLADVSGNASHQFTAGAVSYDFSYATSVFHNGSFVDDHWAQGSGTGPSYFNRMSSAAGPTPAVHTNHSTTGRHGSYISDSAGNSVQDRKTTSTSRATD
jgi:hypothetical protein